MMDVGEEDILFSFENMRVNVQEVSAEVGG